MRILLGLLLVGALVAPTTAASAVPSPRAKPALTVTTIASGLDHPWDVRPLPDGRLLYTQRDRRTLSVWSDGVSRRIAFPSRRIWHRVETGLLGLAIDPGFATNHRIYTCNGWKKVGGGHDIRVMAWTLDAGLTRATKAGTLVKGMPTGNGRHGGCRLLIATDGSMLVGTGDAQHGKVPENKRSLGGKTLRLDPETGAPWPTNPFVHAANKHKRYVETYGHRNVQGLAQRADGTLWSIEQGTDRDDEVNLLRNGGDYGYDPVPGYNESVPMTDHRLPGRQISARWRSGYPTLATSGGTFVPASGWGRLDGTLAVACLKASRMIFLRFDARGRLVTTYTPKALRHDGRLRTAVVDNDGSLLVTTDNGGGRDVILRVRPR
jgi:glucose/arabinose dehydrogenase